MADSSWNREESTGTPASPKSMSRDPRPPLDIIAYRYREEESFQSVLSIGLWFTTYSYSLYQTQFR